MSRTHLSGIDLYLQSVHQFNKEHHSNLINNLKNAMLYIKLNDTDTINLINFTLDICPTINLTTAAVYASSICILQHLYNVDTKKTINYDAVFRHSINDTNYTFDLMQSIFAIQHGAKIWMILMVLIILIYLFKAVLVEYLRFVLNIEHAKVLPRIISVVLI